MNLKIIIEKIGSNGVKDISQLSFDQRQVLVGRSPAADLRLESRQLSLKHLRFFDQQDELVVEDLGSLSGTLVNGTPVSRQVLKVGDEIQIGDHKIKVVNAASPFELTVVIDHTESIDDKSLSSRDLRRLNMAYLLKKSVSISLALVALTLFTLVLIPFLSKSKASWSPGRLTAAHRALQKDCQTCHDGNFSRVRDAKCLSCHQMTAHVSDAYRAEPRCIDCHHEHNDSTHLLLKDSRLCLDCHASKASLKEHLQKEPRVRVVSSFKDHPEIQPELSTSHLKFNHKIHFSPDLETKDSTRKLICSDCHEMKNGVALISGIKFKKHCQDCHSLGFDEGFPNLEAPHKKPDEVYAYLVSIYKTKTPLTMLLDRNRRPGAHFLKTRPRNAREAERFLFLKTGCSLCHRVEERRGVVLADEKSLFSVLLPKLEDRKNEASVKIHRTHQVFKCVSCHSAALTSKNADDNLSPTIKICSDCHADKQTSDRVPSPCSLCHSYHASLSLPAEKTRLIEEAP